MIIKLHDIEDSITVRGTMDGSRYKRPEDEDVAFESPIEYELTVTKIGENLRVEGPVKGSLRLLCARCLEEFSFSVRTHLDVEVAPKSDQPKGSELELKNEEMDLYYYEGDELEIDPYVYEEVMLAVPIKAPCSDACKGICPVCGKNRNIEACECAKPDGTALGEKLKSFLKK